MIMLRRGFIALVAIILSVGSAFAHQQKVALSDIRFNERTGLVEITHRFILHDAEHALSDTFEQRVDLVGDTDALDRFAGYVASRFTIETESEPLELTLIGSEIERGYIWVYQETPLPIADTNWIIRHNALRDVIDGQVNTVNVHVAEGVRTLTFSGAADQRVVRIDAGDIGAEAP